MPLWQIYVTDSNEETDVDFHVKCPMLHCNKGKVRVLIAFFRHSSLNRP